MDGTVLEMQAQLLKGQLGITRLASALHGVGAPKDFDALVYIDELKVLHAIARLSGRSFEETRTTILDFLDADLFNLTAEHCETYLDPLIESWAIDFVSFRMDIVLNHQLSHTHSRRFEFVETGPVPEEPGFKAFLRDRSLSGDATAEELAFLRKLRFAAARSNDQLPRKEQYRSPRSMIPKRRRRSKTAHDYE